MAGHFLLVGNRPRRAGPHFDQRFLHFHDDHADHLGRIVGAVEQVGEIGRDDVAGAAENAHREDSVTVRERGFVTLTSHPLDLVVKAGAAGRADGFKQGLGRNAGLAVGWNTADIGGGRAFRPKLGLAEGRKRVRCIDHAPTIATGMPIRKRA